jgi:hypothetical protein
MPMVRELWWILRDRRWVVLATIALVGGTFVALIRFTKGTTIAPFVYRPF